MRQDYVTFNEAAKLLGKSRATVYRLMAGGMLTPHYRPKDPKHPLFLKSGVLALDVPGPREPAINHKLHEQAKERDGHRCALCFHDTALVAHHRIPVVQGGPDTLDNLVTLCTLCHGSIHSEPKRLVGKAKKHRTLAILNWLIEGVES